LASEIFMTLLVALLMVASVVVRVAWPGSHWGEILPLTAAAVFVVWQVAHWAAQRARGH
jgi:hypothetical protein